MATSVWLVMTGEPLELYGSRPHRIGILSKKLVEMGIDVTWWSTTFDHQEKKYLFHETKLIDNNGVKMFFLHSDTPYYKNIGFARLKNHREVAKEFSRVAGQFAPPEAILCCYPTVDLAYEVTKYGAEKGIRTVVDVRDLWPDIFVNVLPKYFHSFGKLALSSYFKKKEYVFSNCFGLTAVSKSYLEWACKGRAPNVWDRVFPLGYQKSKINPSENENSLSMQYFGLRESALKVWFVGTFGRTYDLSPIISLAKMMEMEGKDIQFVLSGDGECAELWKGEAVDCESVIFTGWLNKEELDSIAGVIDVGVMAYKKGAPQGLPNKIFEYMSIGVPIVCSLETEAKRLIEEELIGFSYRPGEVKDLYEIFQFYLENSDVVRQHGANSLELFEREFSSEVIYNEFAKYLIEI